MLQGTLTTILLLAWLTTILGVAGSLATSKIGGIDADVVGGLGGISAALLWVLVAFGASNLQVVSNGAVVSEPAEALTWFAIGAIGLNILVALLGIGWLLDVRDMPTVEQ